MTRIAFIGLGNMGGGMAARQVVGGREVAAFDLSEAAIAKVVASGATGAKSVAEAVKGADAVITMLPAGPHGAPARLRLAESTRLFALQAAAPGVLQASAQRHRVVLAALARAASQDFFTASDTAWQARWEAAVQAQGLPVFRLPSGAGHDAMKLHELMPQAMLFLRGGNSGISHNPLETITADDTELCVAAFMNLLDNLAQE